MKNEFVKLDEWVLGILVDPLNKDTMTYSEDMDSLISSYGRTYPIENGVYDLRVKMPVVTDDQIKWEQGQIEYENLSKNAHLNDKIQDHIAIAENLKDIYETLKIDGKILDVGGHRGDLRIFLKPDQKYVTCDPFINVFEDLNKREYFLSQFPVIKEPVNFLSCYSEFLPFESSSFDVVHMRSVIDHFYNPALSLFEAFRVLHVGGVLIVGLYVEGGKRGKDSYKRRVKDLIKKAISKIGIKRFDDDHVWHPNYKELIDVISNSGFTIDKTLWQKDSDDHICYIQAIKGSR